MRRGHSIFTCFYGLVTGNKYSPHIEVCVMIQLYNNYCLNFFVHIIACSSGSIGLFLLTGDHLDAFFLGMLGVFVTSCRFG